MKHAQIKGLFPKEINILISFVLFCLLCEIALAIFGIVLKNPLPQWQTKIAFYETCFIAGIMALYSAIR
jgi:hypothetical protein